MSERSYQKRNRDVRADPPKEGIVFGRNAVRELLLSGRPVDKLIVRSGEYEGSLSVIVAMAKKQGIIVTHAPLPRLDALCGGENHQGVCALCASKEYSTLDEVFALAEERAEAPFIVICDGIEDPHNLGAVIRTCECAGVHGVIIPQRRSCGITPVVEKTSAGALEHIPVVKVANLADTVGKLKKRGVWIYSCEVGGEDYSKVDFTGGAAIILGSEGEGISRLLLEKSDFRVSIPMWGKINSLNVSAAAAVVICHAAVSRHAQV